MNFTIKRVENGFLLTRNNDPYDEDYGGAHRRPRQPRMFVAKNQVELQELIAAQFKPEKKVKPSSKGSL